MDLSNDNAEYLVLTKKDLQLIKQFSAWHWEKVPKGLGRDNDLQAYLIINGFLDFLGSKGIKLPVKTDWDK